MYMLSGTRKVYRTRFSDSGAALKALDFDNGTLRL